MRCLLKWHWFFWNLKESAVLYSGEIYFLPSFTLVIWKFWATVSEQIGLFLHYFLLLFVCLLWISLSCGILIKQIDWMCGGKLGLWLKNPCKFLSLLYCSFITHGFLFLHCRYFGWIINCRAQTRLLKYWHLWFCFLQMNTGKVLPECGWDVAKLSYWVI